MAGLDVNEIIDYVACMNHDGHQSLQALSVVMAHGTTHQPCQSVESTNQAISGIDQLCVWRGRLQSSGNLSIEHDLDL